MPVWSSRPSFSFNTYCTVWGVEPLVTHQTCWQESTGECDVQHNQAFVTLQTSWRGSKTERDL